MKHLLIWIFILCCSPLLAQVDTPSDKESTRDPNLPVKADRWLGEDKAQHFLGSFVLTTAGGFFHSIDHPHETGQDARFGLAVAMGLGLAKEFWDASAPNGLFSWKDLVADLLGACLGGLFLWIMLE